MAPGTVMLRKLSQPPQRVREFRVPSLGGSPADQRRVPDIGDLIQAFGEPCDEIVGGLPVEYRSATGREASASQARSSRRSGGSFRWAEPARRRSGPRLPFRVNTNSPLA